MYIFFNQIFIYLYLAIEIFFIYIIFLKRASNPKIKIFFFIFEFKISIICSNLYNKSYLYRIWHIFSIMNKKMRNFLNIINIMIIKNILVE